MGRGIIFTRVNLSLVGLFDKIDIIIIKVNIIIIIV